MKNEIEIKQNAIFWDRFKSLCKNKNITHIELCKNAEIDLGKLKGQIARDIAPNVFDACKIAKYLNTTVEYLVTGVESDEYKNKYETLISDLQNLINV